MSPFSVQIYPRLVSILDMNSTSFTCVNNSKICDLYGAIWDFMQTCLIGNTAFESKNRLLGGAKQSLRRSELSFRRSEQTLLRSEQLKPDGCDSPFRK